MLLISNILILVLVATKCNLTMCLKKEVGERLKQWRTQKGLTQQELAQLLNVSRSTIASWEIGRTEIPYKALKKLKEEFGLDLNWLISGEEN